MDVKMNPRRHCSLTELHTIVVQEIDTPDTTEVTPEEEKTEATPEEEEMVVTPHREIDTDPPQEIEMTRTEAPAETSRRMEIPKRMANRTMETKHQRGLTM